MIGPQGRPTEPEPKLVAARVLGRLRDGRSHEFLSGSLVVRETGQHTPRCTTFSRLSSVHAHENASG